MALGALACGGSERPGATIEFRPIVAADGACEDCQVEQLDNPSAGGQQLLVPREPAVVVEPSSIARFRIVRVGVADPKWRASIVVDPDARERIKKLSREIGDGLVLISASGAPVDVLPAAELGGILVLGRYGSADEVAPAFQAGRAGPVRRVEASDPIVDDFEERLEKDSEFLEDERRREAIWQRIEQAIEEGNREEAERLSEGLD